MNKQWSKNVRDLFSKLLEKDPEERMKHILTIKQHPWFGMVNWDDLLAKKIKPPFVPVLNGDYDVSNFAKEFTNCSINSKPESLDEFINYEGFSFERVESLVKELSLETDGGFTSS